MPINVDALFQAAVILAEQEEWRITTKWSLATGVVNSLSGFAGGCLLGPPGVFIGIGISAWGSYYYTKNKYKPIFAILKEDLRPQQQEELIRLLREAFQDVVIEDALVIVQLFMNKKELGERMKDLVTQYMIKQFMKKVHDQSHTSEYKSKEKMML